MKNVLNLLDKETRASIKEYKDKRFFQFGNNCRYPALNNTVYTSKTKETFWLEKTAQGHLALPFVTMAIVMKCLLLRI